MPDGKTPVNDAVDSDKNASETAKNYIKREHGELEPNEVPSKTGGVC